jgi:hypothetical protein
MLYRKATRRTDAERVGRVPRTGPHRRPPGIAAERYTYPARSFLGTARGQGQRVLRLSSGHRDVLRRAVRASLGLAKSRRAERGPLGQVAHLPPGSRADSEACCKLRSVRFWEVAKHGRISGAEFGRVRFCRAVTQLAAGTRPARSESARPVHGGSHSTLRSRRLGRVGVPGPLLNAGRSFARWAEADKSKQCSETRRVPGWATFCLDRYRTPSSRSLSRIK